MATIREFFQNLLYQVPAIGITDIVDILVVSIIFYSLLRLIRSTSAARVARAILLLLAITLLTDVLNLYTLNWLLNKILEVGAIALIIVFQPELRRALERVGAQLHFHLLSTESAASIEQSAVNATVQACEIMSRERVGVLLVFERETPLDEYFKTGTIVDAQLSEQLLRNLFFKNSPLHDGAVIIRGDRIVSATCYLPLSDNLSISKDLGTRHRAALGISETSDSLTVVVSEETGRVSLARDGQLTRISDQETRYICPVFIHIGMYSLCNDRTCDIRTATGECLNTSVWLCTIKSRNNCTLCILQPFRKDLVCLISVKITIFIKDDYFCSIDEFISKICSHDDTIQIFSTGSRIISADFLAEVCTDCFKFLIQAQIQVQSSDDAVISLFDCL